MFHVAAAHSWRHHHTESVKWNWIVAVVRSFANRSGTPTPKAPNSPSGDLGEWTRSLPEEDAEALVDSSAGKPVRWVPGEGWAEGRD